MDRHAEVRGELLVEPRLLTENDIPWMAELAKARYGGDRYTFSTTEGWFRNIVLKQPLMFYAIRSENAFCIAMLSVLPWLPSESECTIVFICCAEGAMWEGVRLLRDSVEWGRSRKCTTWKLSSDTQYELAAMAKRLGCSEQSPRYILRY